MKSKEDLIKILEEHSKTAIMTLHSNPLIPEYIKLKLEEKRLEWQEYDTNNPQERVAYGKYMMLKELYDGILNGYLK